MSKPANSCSKDVEKEASASELLRLYLKTSDLELLKSKFSELQSQKTRIKRYPLNASCIAKGFASFNLLPSGGAERYLESVTLDDKEALCSDWNEVGELVSQAWIQTKLEDCVK